MKTTFAVCLALALVAVATCNAPSCIEHYHSEAGDPCKGQNSLSTLLVTWCCEDLSLYPKIHSHGGHVFCTCVE
ncbi:hypothetical protein RRG08_019854 [Elysia crispata]|uniref:Plethodontid modulating factor n=1 Tax=Elysia crispata TaxID=231223 RepID=A0AAE1AHF5_9GAST|nr:hypothetical protein RRG08_019854 [Elysia crispata]